MNGQICLKKVNGVKYLETKGVYKICSGLVKVYIVWRSIVSNFGAKLKKKISSALEHDLELCPRRRRYLPHRRCHCHRRNVADASTATAICARLIRLVSVHSSTGNKMAKTSSRRARAASSPPTRRRPCRHGGARTSPRAASSSRRSVPVHHERVSVRARGVGEAAYVHIHRARTAVVQFFERRESDLIT